ncbi:MAG: CDP-diacylglycerol--serine O-phosphatidyltransferase [Bacteroidia bacterium]
MLKHIPNALTCTNLFLGCLAIVNILDHNLTEAATMIAIAAVIDFFDGFVARLLKVSGEFGKQLDSLADVVTFGVAPGLIVYSLQQDYLIFGSNFFQFVPLLIIISYLPFLIPVFSALRLAKFNIDSRQSFGFYGLPTPANALFIIAIPFVMQYGPAWAGDMFTSNAFLIIFPLISSYLLVSEIPMFALKFKNFSLGSNKIRFGFIALCVLMLSLFKFLGVSLCITLYVLLSIILKLTNKNEI